MKSAAMERKILQRIKRKWAAGGLADPVDIVAAEGAGLIEEIRGADGLKDDADDKIYDFTKKGALILWPSLKGKV